MLLKIKLCMYFLHTDTGHMNYCCNKCLKVKENISNGVVKVKVKVEPKLQLSSISVCSRYLIKL